MSYIKSNNLKSYLIREKKNKNNLCQDIKNDDNLENLEDLKELEELEKEFKSKVYSYKSGDYQKPKNHGNLWTEQEKLVILKWMEKNDYNNLICNMESNNSNGTNEYWAGMFDDNIIDQLSQELQRTQGSIREEIKKMVFTEYLKTLDYISISKKFNIPETNIKIIVKKHLEKNEKIIISSIETENKLLKVQIENIKLKNELIELIELMKK